MCPRHPPPESRRTTKATQDSEADKPHHRPESLEVPTCKQFQVRRSDKPHRTARISLQCVQDVKEHTTPDDNSATAPKSLRALYGTAIDVIRSGTSAWLLPRRCPTVEARFTERIRGRQELFLPVLGFPYRQPRLRLKSHRRRGVLIWGSGPRTSRGSEESFFLSPGVLARPRCGDEPPGVQGAGSVWGARPVLQEGLSGG